MRVFRCRLGVLAWWIFRCVWILVFVDISGDYALFHDSEYWNAETKIPVLRTAVQSVLSGLVGVLAILGGIALLDGRLRTRPRVEVRGFLWFFFLSVAFGVFVGLLRGVPIEMVVGDARNAGVYLAYFAIGSTWLARSEVALRRLVTIAFFVLLAKLVYTIANDLIFHQFLRWRYLYKTSVFFIPFFFVYASRLLYVDRVRADLRAVFPAAMCALGIFAGQSRAHFVGVLSSGVIALMISLSNPSRLFRTLAVGALVLIVGLLAGVLFQADVSKSFGYWEGEIFEVGYRYRLDQLDMLLGVFWEHPVAGAGLGAYNPDYTGYREWLPRPYLVEMEYANLLAKLGLFGMGSWCIAFLMLFAACRRAVRRAEIQYRGLVLGLSIGLVGMMVASAFQTGYSSILFHVYVLHLLLVISSGEGCRTGLPQRAEVCRDRSMTP